MQPEFSASILLECQEKEIHTAIETALNGQWADIVRLLEHTDLVMADIKMIDAEKHRRATGISNNQILKNALKLSQMNVPVIVRVPVIPGVNDDGAEIEAIAKYVAPFKNLAYLEFLPFHRLGEGKYDSLGLPVATRKIPQMDSERMKEIQQLAAECDVRVKGVNDVNEDGTTSQKVV